MNIVMNMKGMAELLEWLLLIFLVVCSIAVSVSRNLLNTVIIFMAYSLVMAVLWVLLQAPDLAVTEAAVGAGVTSVLFFLTLERLGILGKKRPPEEKASTEDTSMKSTSTKSASMEEEDSDE